MKTSKIELSYSFLDIFLLLFELQGLLAQYKKLILINTSLKIILFGYLKVERSSMIIIATDINARYTSVLHSSTSANILRLPPIVNN